MERRAVDCHCEKDSFLGKGLDLNFQRHPIAVVSIESWRWGTAVVLGDVPHRHSTMRR